MVALVLLIALTRWPLLTSPDLVLDGDEAIVGLMAMDLADGRRVPLYFDGQSFGVSIVETGAIAAAFRLAGPSTEAAKVAVLALWILGWVLFVEAVRLWVDRPTALVAGALLATMPAWGNWSMMARGYHLGGFVTAQASIWWFARSRAGESTGSARMVVAGALLALLALTQALFLVEVLPFAGLMLAERRRRRDWIGLAVGAGIVLLPSLAVRFGQSSYWSPSYVGTLNILRAPLRVAGLLWTCLGGGYYYERRLPVSSATIVASVLWVIAAAIAFVRIVTRIRWPSERVAWTFEVSAAAAFLAVLGAAALMTPLELAVHHLLAATVPLVLFVAVTIREALERTLAERAVAAVLTAALLGSGMIAIGGVPALWAARSSTTNAPQRSDLTALVAVLEDRGLEDVYCLDGMLQWNLMFMSGGRISARWLAPVDRRPDVPMAVDRALWEGRPTALVGAVRQRPFVRRQLASAGLGDLELQTVGDTYFWMARPTPAVLTALQFRLHEKESPSQPAGRERGMH